VPTLAVASSWVELSAVPEVIAAGAAHVMTGVTLFTVIVTVLVTVPRLALDGVKVAVMTCDPAVRTVPAAGE
jgi:hypothetical protein